jgi:hypothetical protein
MSCSGLPSYSLRSPAIVPWGDRQRQALRPDERITAYPIVQKWRQVLPQIPRWWLLSMNIARLGRDTGNGGGEKNWLREQSTTRQLETTDDGVEEDSEFVLGRIDFILHSCLNSWLRAISIGQASFNSTERNTEQEFCDDKDDTRHETRRTLALLYLSPSSRHRRTTATTEFVRCRF